MSLARKRLRRMRRDDSGSALVFALMVVLLVGATLAAALDFTTFGLNLAPKVRVDRNESNYVQGAVEGAINNIRYSSETGRADRPDCPDFTPPAVSGLPGVDGHTFVVTCTPVGNDTEVGADVPRFAILALPTVSGEGIRQNAGNAELTINGGVYSKGVITVNSGPGNDKSKMMVYGTVLAEGSCTGRIATVDLAGIRCDKKAPFTTYDDPRYAPALAATTSSALRASLANASVNADPKPKCLSNRVEFYPGYYSVRPDELVARVLPTCGETVFNFTEGVYVFNYTGVWRLGTNKIKAVGGKYLSDTLGAACDAEQNGVQFVFGGGSRVDTQSSAGGDTGMELCGPTGTQTLPGGEKQRIAIYGLDDKGDKVTVGVPTAQSDDLEATADPTPSPANAFYVAQVPPLPPIDTTTNARRIDGSLAVAALDRNEVAQLTYADFDAVPPGARVSKVTVRLTQTLVNSTSSIDLIVGSGPSAPVITRSANCGTCAWDVTTDLLGVDAGWRAVNDLSIRYRATGPSGNNQTGTASIDGVEVDVEFTDAAYEALTCTADPCVFFESTNNPNVFIHGTVYTPSARWAVNVHNSGETIFQRGVVLRDVQVAMSASSKQTSAPFQLPTATRGRYVMFRGYVDNVGGVEKVRACVKYNDTSPLPNNQVSAFPGYSLSVKRWVFFRGAGGNASGWCPTP